jgi:AraC-like DNA-binding protein
LGVEPEFNAEHNSILLSRDDLVQTLGPANQHLQTLVESYLDMYAPAPRCEIERQAHEALMNIMRAGPASIDDVADMLRMHPRTLQRRLMASGTTFERVRDNVRKSMAEFYLASDMVPLAQVAHLLGYANQSALTRSCVRWFGTTPLAFRQNLRRKQMAN